MTRPSSCSRLRASADFVAVRPAIPLPGVITAEAIRLGRMVHALLPDDSEVAGLLALMLLTDARRAARTDANGELMPMADQDRSRWNATDIEEGVALITDALPKGRSGRTSCKRR
jgi:predicted RNA polymerase sigma factor